MNDLWLNRHGVMTLASLCLVVGPGCSSVPKGELTVRPEPQASSVLSSNTAPPKVFKHIPKHRPKTAQKFNPVFWFGNMDRPFPPESYRPADPNRVRKWYWRNPGHNFTFYVVGITDKEFERVGRFPENVFHSDGGWNWAVCRYKCLRLPFVSYERGRFQFYCGWRNRGNFGTKLACRSRSRFLSTQPTVQ